MQPLKFAMIGCGYIGPRHMDAIKQLGHELVAFVNVNDNVGIVDKFFPNAEFFTDIEHFDRWLQINKVDWITICTPNYLHDSHIRFAQEHAQVICEKPLVLNEHNIKFKDTVFTILQLRLHPLVNNLKNKISADQYYKCQLNYCTPRGKWYDHSWKGDVHKSGGITTNIGIHLFDMLYYLFGEVIRKEFTVNSRKAHGTLFFKNAEVAWSLSIEQGKPERSMIVNGELINFTEGFDNLHTESYQQILQGNGFTQEDARYSIKLVSEMRQL